MSVIQKTRGQVTLGRTGEGANVQWCFRVEGQTSTPFQELIINDATTLSDLKLIIGQVEYAAKVLGEESTFE